MPASEKRLVVFVHGWSVSHTNTYGEFAARLEREAERDPSLELDVHNIWLGKYVSFHDAVRVEDLARGFNAAIERELGPALRAGQRFACITHSTGGPVVREWWDRFYNPSQIGPDCPMSHLIMLAPANFGSALAQLGKGRISRLKSWIHSVEPGTGVLKWLELGSSESFELNQRWMDYPDFTKARGGVYPFVLTGQSIDRKLYDHVNSYTGEKGSDGVVRVPSANLNASYIKLQQRAPTKTQIDKILKRANTEGSDAKRAAATRDALRDLELPLTVVERSRARRTAFSLVEGRSHSGDEMGILASVEDNRRSHPTVKAVLKCLEVGSKHAYLEACRHFDREVERVFRKERVEVHDGFFRDSYTIHDAHSMVVFRLFDDRGFPLDDYDLKLTGENGDPDKLPPGFFADRQRNSDHPGTVTFFLNHDLMLGSSAVRHKRKQVRAKRPGATELGIELIPRPRSGYTHYHRAVLRSTARALKDIVRPHETVLVDIELRRVVHEGVFELTRDRVPHDFRDQPVGGRVD
ncbi:MAG: phospholipase [Planctomycetota bacterium]|nr:MAG: phospholipase [Planctomycetota bacterium]